FFGQAKAAAFRPDQMHFPAPDFVVEVVSASTAAVDRGIKLLDYALHGVGEYWIVDPEAESLEQYLLDEGAEAYRLALQATAGEVRSRVVSGFVIPVRALFDDAVHRRTLQAILRGA
ncbi:MAG: Uma2 family endonuclease, partial [Candidatus Methanomethylicaceae archaeon]